jgi:hypothetical protein
MRTIEQWADLVGGAVRLSDPNDAWRIGAMCFDAERAGAIVNVWHNSALFYGVTCHCASCNAAAPFGERRRAVAREV